ncbi:MAG TPA: Cys-tRNA(Pro) deacylase [Acidimicrobiales bacterium]|nr:Cys-tRNA(Pro) deacylase [Acidimicrobiales bacterium]
MSPVAGPTPAVTVAARAGVDFEIHRYDHDPDEPSYGEEAAEMLGVEPDRVYKTLVVLVDDRLAVAVVPVSGELDLKKLAAALGARKAVMAHPSEAERATGYVVGGISPLGQKRRLPTVLDASAERWPTIFVSGGRRGLELELAPADLARLAGATVAAVGR